MANALSYLVPSVAVMSGNIHHGRSCAEDEELQIIFPR